MAVAKSEVVQRPLDGQPEPKHYGRLREYVLDPAAAFPENIKLFMWAYYGQRIATLQAVGIVNTYNPKGMLLHGDVQKFYPFGFLWSTNPDVRAMQFAVDITPVGAKAAGETALLPFENDLLPEDWPEYVGDNGVILHSNDTASFVAEKFKRPFKRRKNRRG